MTLRDYFTVVIVIVAIIGLGTVMTVIAYLVETRKENKIFRQEQLNNIENILEIIEAKIKGEKQNDK